VRNFLIALTLVSALAAPARAALTLNIDGGGLCLQPGEVRYLEVHFTETPPAVDENLLVYSVGLQIQGNSSLAFGPASLVGATVEHPFVIPAGASYDLDVLRASERELYVFVDRPAGIAEGVNIADGAGVLRFPVTLRGSPVFGQATIHFDLTPAGTVFADERGEAIPFIPTAGSFTICPEPSALAGVLATTVALALRRRREIVY
jgi:hypothetical protein